MSSLRGRLWIRRDVFPAQYNSAIIRSRARLPAQHHSQPRPLSVQLFHGRGLRAAGSICRIREPSRAASIAEQLHPIGKHMARPGGQRRRQRIAHNHQSRLSCLTRLAGLLLGLIALPRRCIGNACKALLRQLCNGDTIPFIDSSAKPSLHIGGLQGKLIGSPLRHRKPQLHRRPATRSGKVRHICRQLQRRRLRRPRISTPHHPQTGKSQQRQRNDRASAIQNHHIEASIGSLGQGA